MLVFMCFLIKEHKNELIQRSCLAARFISKTSYSFRLN